MNSGVLVDTNVLLWALFGTRLTKENLNVLGYASEVYVSSLSILEVRIKQVLGKLPFFNILENIEKMDFSILPLSGLHAQHYTVHADNNKDPFDNTLISIAIAENLRFMTSDKLILGAHVTGLTTIDARA